MKRIKKLPFPSHLAVTECTVEIKTPEINADGEQETYKIGKLKCIFDESSQRKFTSDGKEIAANALVIIEGDIAPALGSVSSGNVTVGGSKLQIVKGSRLRNPDGTVHHTELEVI